MIAWKKHTKFWTWSSNYVFKALEYNYYWIQNTVTKLEYTCTVSNGWRTTQHLSISMVKTILTTWWPIVNTTTLSPHSLKKIIEFIFTLGQSCNLWHSIMCKIQIAKLKISIFQWRKLQTKVNNWYKFATQFSKWKLLFSKIYSNCL